MRHVLIGGNGFLGREVARQVVARGERAVIIDLAPVPHPELAALGQAIDYVQGDITISGAFDGVALDEGDAVHHLASKLIVPNRPRVGRDAYFHDCIVNGTRNVIDWLVARRHYQLVFWSTDMVYGPALATPRDETHPRHPYGPYGRAKVAAEDMLAAARRAGLKVTMLRPRLIMGPGRLGIFTTLFGLVDKGLPIPLIGDGTNRFQFVSVADCARASLLAVDRGYPDVEINLGSAAPPTVSDLLSDFLNRSGARSRLLRTPASPVKRLLRLLSRLKISPMDSEQFEIADQDVTLDIRRAAEILGWIPADSDKDMLLSAYRSYRAAGRA